MSTAIAIQQRLDLETIECGECGIVFAVTEQYRRGLIDTSRGFYCPNGHRRAYTESQVDKLRKELAAKERALIWEQERVASLNKQLKRERTATKKFERRVSVGVCPCCQRTVSQLARHMQSKHPEFVAESRP